MAPRPAPAAGDRRWPGQCRGLPQGRPGRTHPLEDGRLAAGRPGTPPAPVACPAASRSAGRAPHPASLAPHLQPSTASPTAEMLYGEPRPHPGQEAKYPRQRDLRPRKRPSRRRRARGHRRGPVSLRAQAWVTWPPRGADEDRREAPPARRRPGQAGPLSSRPRRPGPPGMCGSGWPHSSRSTGCGRPGAGGIFARTTGRAGQQHARSSSHSGQDHLPGTGGGLPDSGALLPAPMCGNLGFMISLSPASTGPAET